MPLDGSRVSLSNIEWAHMDGLTGLACIGRLCFFPLPGASQSCLHGAAGILSVPEADWSTLAICSHSWPEHVSL